MLIAFLYILIVVRPDFYFHHAQPPFLFAHDFLEGYLDYPGGLSQWLGMLFMQSFYSRFLGPVLLFGLALATWRLTLTLMNRVSGDRYEP